jgi:hypothetical protein
VSQGLAGECAAIVGNVNAEMAEHKIITRPAEISRHSDGLAVDVNVDACLQAASIDALALQHGLKRPSPIDDPVHFELVETPIVQSLSIEGHSPINIMVTDPLGHKLGYDAASGTVVNEIGGSATYNGPGVEPQIIFLSYAEVVDGEYSVSGVGTGTGSYTILMQAWLDGPVGEPRILSTGVAEAGTALDEVAPFDVTSMFVTFPLFRRGDANADASVDIGDAIVILSYLFGTAEDPSKLKVERCLDAADANDDEMIDIADAIKVLAHLFADAGPLPEPFGTCGFEVATDALACQRYPACN